MKWLQTAWPLLRDIGLTITGLWLIISQVGAHDPNSTLIVAGLTLVMPAAASHARAVLSGPSAPSPDTPHGELPSSEHAPPPSSSPSSPPGGGTDGRG